MFNHARTLLANLAGGLKSPGEDYLGEELISATFHPVNLPAYLLQIRKLLFGMTPDRAMINYRCRQYLSLIEATPVREFLYAEDSRVTYDTANGNQEFYLTSTFEPKVTRNGGSLSDQLTLIGKPLSPDSIGKLRYQYYVDVLTPESIKISRLTPKTFSDIQPLTLTKNLSQPLELAGTGYKFFVNTSNPGTAWTIEGYLRPQWDLGQIASLLERLPEPITLELFGLEHVEPWETFRNLWFDHPELPYRLAGFISAVIYRAEEVRIGQR